VTSAPPHPAEPAHGGARPSPASLVLIPAFLLLGLPALYVRFADPHLPVLTETAIFGVGILGAAFVLGIAAEASEHDLPPALGLAILAFVAVLPEYAVDLVFAWRAGTDPEQAQFAVANMTGGNRLLIGVGWAAVLVAAVLIKHIRVIQLPRSLSVEVAVLVVASLYSLSIPIKGSISLVDTVVLFSLVAFYLYRLSRQARTEPEIGGPAAVISRLPKRKRRAATAALFTYAAVIILASAERFADGLIHTGLEFGIDQFLLVQWVAPLASESPEFLAAIYLVWRGNASGGMTALISSKVNQWTLLIGSLAIAYSISGETLSGLPMDLRQREEVLLTAAQSVFAVMLIVDKRLSARAAVPLFGLFILQFFFHDELIRMVLAGVYFVLAAGLLLVRRRTLVNVMREGFAGGALPEIADETGIEPLALTEVPRQ
jgi:cation:H+ antiporter